MRSDGLRAGEIPVAPDVKLPLASNFLWMLTGRLPTADEAQAMNLILILHAEHGLNASTFAARVITATLSDVYSAVTGAIGALKGPLHGGANTAVLKTLEEIGDVERVASWVEAALARKEKFMGFGHAVYKTKDPRVEHLKEASRRLGIKRGDTRLFDVSVELEKRVTAAIGKHCNVDFYSASVQDALGIAGEMFTCVFAASRIVGSWPTFWSSWPTTRSSGRRPNTWAPRTAATPHRESLTAAANSPTCTRGRQAKRV